MAAYPKNIFVSPKQDLVGVGCSEEVGYNVFYVFKKKCGSVECTLV